MKFKLRRPTLDTRFHVDWSWFERNNINAESIIRNQLPDAYQQAMAGEEVREVDYIDPMTGEVFRMDNLRETILIDAQWEEEFITEDMPLSQAILRVFLATNNHPMTAREMAQRLERSDPEAILRMLTATGVSNGVVPLRE